MRLNLVLSGQASEATLWVEWRPGDVEPWLKEVLTFAGTECRVQGGGNLDALEKAESECVYDSFDEDDVETILKARRVGLCRQRGEARP